MDEPRNALPAYKHQVFPSAALEMSLVQVRYPPVARFKDSARLGSLSEALAQQYPLFTTEQAMNLVVMPQGVGTAPGGDVLRFTSIDNTWSVTLTGEFVSLETRSYSDIDTFVERFTAVLGLVGEHLRIRYQLRFGLRYVNEFRHDKGTTYAGWQGLLNPEFIGSGGAWGIDGTVEQTVHEVRTRRSDGTLLVRHGFLSGTTVAPTGRAQPKNGPFYLLDLDYYDESAVAFEPAPAQRMRAYNNVLYSIFRFCIGDGELFQALGGQK